MVDAVEAGVAVIEDPEGRLFTVPAAWLPAGTRGGEVLLTTTIRDAGAALTALREDPDAAASLLEAAAERLERLRGRDPGGDLEL